ncbi:MAG: hypothetical protein ACYS80_20450, partial [Planctomycetota bacterium]
CLFCRTVLELSSLSLAGRAVLLLFEQAQLFAHRPVNECKDQRYNYFCHWQEHKQTEGPAIARFAKYSTKAKYFYGCEYQYNEGYKKDENYFCRTRAT